MTAFEFGITLNRIAHTVTDEDLEKIKGDLNLLEAGIIDLLDEKNKLEDKINAK